MPADLLGNMRNSFGGFYARMFRSVLLTLLIVGLLVGGARRQVPALALPFLFALADRAGHRLAHQPDPAGRGQVRARAAQQRELRLIARRTWRFFETFVTAEDNHLPPDNFQEDPRPVVAHRTSPTNIGLYLLSIVAARDFGWCGLRDALDRIEATLGTLTRMARHRGHLYNWYDTQDLRPLEPRYVSSVDSGNLAAHLMTLAGTFREWQQKPSRRRRRPSPASPTRSTWRARRCANFAFDPGQTISREMLETAFDDLEARCGPTGDPLDAARSLAVAAERASTLVDMVRTLASETARATRQPTCVYWVEAARRTIDSWRSDLLARDPAGFIVEHLESLATTALELAHAMEFGFLLDAQRKLLSIGYRATDGTLDPSCYDLLASEARLASFVAIAKGDIPARHWFRLGRTVTPDRRRRGARVLVGLDVRVPDAGPGAARAGR